MVQQFTVNLVDIKFFFILCELLLKQFIGVLLGVIIKHNKLLKIYLIIQYNSQLNNYIFSLPFECYLLTNKICTEPKTLQ